VGSLGGGGRAGTCARIPWLRGGRGRGFFSNGISLPDVELRYLVGMGALVAGGGAGAVTD
jgi:hypothetical protein